MAENSTQIFIHDNLPPEDNAMLQALYSRSPDSVVNHLEKVRGTGSGNFMEKFYVGYGHASIGDCGTTTLFIEQVSMLMAKAIQSSPLYNGQEASTRYLDFSKQGCVDPYNRPETKAVQDAWMELYTEILPKVQEALKAERPFNADEYKTEKIWQNAIFARSFDICRALLPVGARTLLSWTVNLRQARDHLRSLKHHPCAEVRDVAKQIFAQLKEKYPNSYIGDEMDDDVERYAERDAYSATHAATDHLFTPERAMLQFCLAKPDITAMINGETLFFNPCVRTDCINRLEAEAIHTRPKGAALPWRLETYGRYNLAFMMDFGSFRDIQRHRNGVCRIPLVTGQFGLHPWYDDQFKAYLGTDYADFKARFDAILAQIADLETQGIANKPAETQYLFPMGMNCLIQMTCSVPQMVYIGELRSQKSVHPTVRPVAQAMLKQLEKDLPGIATYGDMDSENWTAKRGTETIEMTCC